MLITKKTKAIVLVDYAGQPCDVDFFMQIAQKQRIFVVEDAAHSLGSTYKKKPVGSLADITTFSFYPTKNITTGEGGAVASKNEQILSRVKLFARQGLVRSPNLFVYKDEGEWHQEVHHFGLNYRMPDILCALGISQLKKLHIFKEIRRNIFQSYKEAFEGLDYVRTLSVESYADPMWHLFPIFVDNKIRGDLFRYLQGAGIGVRVNYFPSHLHPVFREQGYNPGTCKNAEELYKSEISLPMHTKLRSGEIERIVKLIERFFGKTKR
jgi:dTDP-4-amino-4,6-dideoxygalactose transaminase